MPKKSTQLLVGFGQKSFAGLEVNRVLVGGERQCLLAGGYYVLPRIKKVLIIIITQAKA